MSTQRQIDQIPAIHPRPVEMQVLCLGLSRTGTMTMFTAMNKLGFKSYHMLEAASPKRNRELRHVYCWVEALRYKVQGIGKPYGPADFDKLLQEYSAVTDMPCVNFSDELLSAFPNAKVVLTQREPTVWIKSFEHSIYQVLSWKIWPFLRYIDPKGMGALHDAMQLSVADWTAPEPWDNRRALAAHMKVHVDHIRSVVPPEKLLEFHPRDGWEVLCKFLGKDIPNEPFPHANKGDNAATLIKVAVVVKLIKMGLPYLTVLGGLIAAWAWLNNN